MYETAEELRARGIDVQSDEDWHRDFEAKRAELAQSRQEAEIRASEREAADAAERAKWAALADDPKGFERELQMLLGLEPEPGPEIGSDATPATVLAAHTPDDAWVKGEIDAVFTGSGSLPYHAEQASRRLHDTHSTMRYLSRRNMHLDWQGSKEPVFAAPVNSSENSTCISTIKKEVNIEVEEEERKNRIDLPAHFPSKGIPERTIAVSVLDFANLPRWKEIGTSGMGSGTAKEIQLGLRIASLADDSADLSTWLSDVPGNDVGFLSINLAGDAAKRFLAGEHGDAGAALRRGLFRSLQTHTGDFAAVAVWTANEADPNVVTLFMALRMTDHRGVSDAVEVDRGSRYIWSLEAGGVDVVKGMPNRSQLPAYYGLSEKELAICAAADPMDPFAPSWLDFLQVPEGGQLEEYTLAAGFASPEEIMQRQNRAESHWLRTVHAHGLPSWFSNDFVEQVRDYLVRDPLHAKALACAIARMKKRNPGKTGRVDFERQRLIDLLPTDMRFYKGSPAQFAALAASSGRVLGSHCDNRHKAGRAKELYQKLRDAVVRK